MVTRGVAGLDGRPAILMGAPKPQRCFHSFPSGQRRVERADPVPMPPTGACTHVVRDRGARPCGESDRTHYFFDFNFFGGRIRQPEGFDSLPQIFLRQSIVHPFCSSRPRTRDSARRPTPPT